MKGLLIKDLKLMKNMRLLLAFAAVFSCAIAANGTSPTFCVSYVGFIFCICVISTLSYDERGNGRAFLFTLPLMRRTYVSEKYLFGVCGELAVWLLFSALACVFLAARGKETGWTDVLCELGLYLVLFLVLIAVMLPVQIRFGSEKGRIIVAAAMAGVIGVVLGLIKAAELLRWTESSLIRGIVSLGMPALAAGTALLAALLLAVSYRISIRLVEKLQF